MQNRSWAKSISASEENIHGSEGKLNPTFLEFISLFGSKKFS